jgi:hypothetical protein
VPFGLDVDKARLAWRLPLVLVTWLGSANLADAAPALQALTVEPSSIQLRGANRQQQILVTGRTAEGKLIDLTHACELTLDKRDVARLSGAVVYGVANGAAELRVKVGTLTARVPVQVRDFERYPPVHFGNDVVPLFSKLGCNSASCHGKASGQNGFKLSVFGFDPAADYNALVKEARGRRIFPANPRHSLLLLKPTGRMAHGGGRRLEPNSPDYERLLHWLEQGTPFGRADAPRPVALRVSPGSRVMGARGRQQIVATAVFSDGSQRDVTAAATYSTNAGLVADVDRRGLVHTGKIPGEAAITVNYMGHVAAVRIQVPRLRGPEPYPQLPVNNHIDDLVWAKLKTMGIVPSEQADDATFLRRAYLDAIGTLPTPAEVRAFLADKWDDKRRRWIDDILDRDEYADYWALKWADILLVDRKKLGERGAFEFHRWLREQFARNRPYDVWVRELLTASGASAKNGPVNFFRAAATPEEAAKAVSQAFLGIRLQCAQCHHHPFEKWSQEDFHGLAGFFNGMTRRPTQGEELVYHAGYRETRLPATDKPIATHPPDGPVPEGLQEGDPRRRLAAWMTKPENPWFARLAANRLWKHYMGRGLVEPEDDVRSTNPATNEPLLDYLADQLVKSRYDLKALSRLILNARVYQLSAIPNETNRDDDQNFSHHYVRRLPAEVLLDAISAVTESPEMFPGMAKGTRAIELWDNRLPSYFLDIFGRSERTSPCECGRSSEPTMAQALHLMNAPEVERKIASRSGRVARLLKAKTTENRMVEELCLAALGRPPGEKERRVAKMLFGEAPAEQAAQDFLWALLNSYDFLFAR